MSQVLKEGVYVDHNASTPPDESVVEAMLPWLRDFHANPHSVHKRGQLAAAAVEKARAQVAGLIGADVEDVFFTSGATESSNLILQGLLARPKAALIASSVEHKCVLEIGHALSANGTRFSKVPVDVFGRVSPAAIAESVAQHGANELVVVAVMHANNEIGTVQPITEISASLEGRGVFFHVDASQSCSRIPVDVSALGADTLCVSSHKLYGPAGIGAAYISPYARAQLRPLMFGGGQQSGVRPGTIPVFLAVGFGAACELAGRRLQDDTRMMNDCVDAFLGTLRQTDASFTRIGHLTEALPGLVALRFPGCDSGDLLARLSKSVFASAGSACSAGQIRASHVARAIGLSEEDALEIVRFGFGRSNTIEDAVYVANAVVRALKASQHNSGV